MPPLEAGPNLPRSSRQLVSLARPPLGTWKASRSCFRDSAMVGWGVEGVPSGVLPLPALLPPGPQPPLPGRRQAGGGTWCLPGGFPQMHGPDNGGDTPPHKDSHLQRCPPKC